MRFVLASHNKGKLAELQEILGELGVEVVLQSDVGLDLEPDETGTTFAENAKIKAQAVMEASGLPAIADDSGLCVDALQGGPGVYSARYGEPGMTQPEKNQMLLRTMQGQFPRTCHFACHITCCFPNGDQLDAEGICSGTVAFASMGDGGFGFDPIFFVPKLKKTFAQLTAEEKNAISHPGNAPPAGTRKTDEETPPDQRVVTEPSVAGGTALPVRRFFQRTKKKAHMAVKARASAYETVAERASVSGAMNR